MISRENKSAASHRDLQPIIVVDMYLILIQLFIAHSPNLSPNISIKHIVWVGAIGFYIDAT